MPWVDTEPASFQNSCASGTRENYIGQRRMRPWRITDIRPAFALNTQRNLELSFYVTDSPSVPDDTIPGGMNLLSNRGPQAYIVGDGEEGEKNVRINKKFPEGMYPCVSANNNDASHPHTVDVVINIQEWLVN